nr:extracellular solute-binding protein [Pseudovibrio exalbescens]
MMDQTGAPVRKAFDIGNKARPPWVWVVVFGVACIFIAGAAKAREQTSLSVLTRNGPAIAGPAVVHANAFSRDHETTVVVDVVHLEHLYDVVMVDFLSGRHPADVLVIPATWVPDFAAFLSDVPAWLIHGPHAGGIHPVYRRTMMGWNQRWLGVTIDGDLQMGVFRRDLFDDPQTRADFEAEFGRTLQPPQTWREFNELTRFFNGRLDPSGRPLLGSLEAFKQEDQGLWSFISRAVAYGSHPNYPGAFFFDPVTMEPSINSPAWKRALGEYMEALSHGPNEARFMGGNDVRYRFAEGHAALAIGWQDIGILAADWPSAIGADKVGFFALPGSREVWNPVTDQWNALPRARSVPYLAFGGWVAVVPVSTKDRNLAWSFVAEFGSPENSALDTKVGVSGINPYRAAELTNIEGWQAVLGEEGAQTYLDINRQALNDPALVAELRLPGYQAYMEALTHQVERALNGMISVDQALDTAAAQWEQITDRLGRDSQRRHYQDAIGYMESEP